MLAYVYELITLVALFAIASLSLNLIVARAGLFSMMHGALIGIGAYAYALVTTHSGFWPIVAMLVAIFITATIGMLAAICSVRLDEEQFAVTTLALQILVVNIFVNWDALTNGSYGISQIPRIMLPGIVSQSIGFPIITVFAMGVSAWIFSAVSRSGFGILLMSSAAEQDLVESLGCPVLHYRTYAFALGSAGAGLAGALFAMHASYIAPQLFELHLSILVLAMVIIGGGNTIGAIVGAAVLILIPELFRFLAFESASIGPLRQIMFGCLLVGMIFLRAARSHRRDRTNVA